MFMNTQEQEEKVSEAFSRQSVVFDDIYETNPITLWMRSRFRNEVLKFIRPGDNILELNCGTGIDTLFFAQKGYKILATDNAEGMLDQVKEKISKKGLQELVSSRKYSFNDLSGLEGQKFGYIYSNFGGLNCTDDLVKVLKDIDQLLLPGGHFTFTIMPKVCLWEIFEIFKGRRSVAFRRFKKGGANAHIEGVYFKCHYYNPSYVIKHAGINYSLSALNGLASFVPPPSMEHFPGKYPKLFSLLKKIEEPLCRIFPFNRWCDQYVITMQKMK